MNKRWVKLKKLFEGLYNRFNHRNLIKPDPLQFVYQYNSPSDKEIVAFLAAALAYGRVEQIEKSLTNLFTRMGKSPYAFVQGFDIAKRERLYGFKHRFTTGQDISDLLALLKKVLNRYGSIQSFFVEGYNPSDKNIIPPLTRFCDSLRAMYAKENHGQPSVGLKFLLAGPAARRGGARRSPRGSACKRLNLFLRWMVRKDDVDLGLWKSVDKAKLIVPVDVHIGRLCRILGFYSRKTVSLPAAVEITESFAQIEPADPVKFDFALSRIGITEGCNGKFDLRCEGCEIFDFCHS
ncbi:MAG: TIGR02757 family protein [Planctomycetota bacterium]|nr:TIGR02757 family protein [Planctomycetota bacterium]